jgi:hypothetical protein
MAFRSHLNKFAALSAHDELVFAARRSKKIAATLPS